MAASKGTDTDASVRALNLYQKLAAITGEVGAIAKDGKNTDQNFSFIEYAAVAGRLRELFSKYGVVVVPRMSSTKSWVREKVTSKYGKEGYAVLVPMSFNVVNADAPDDKFTVTWTGEAIDYGDKATNKAATSALKYYLMRQFNISEKGDDPDAESPERAVTTSSTPKPVASRPAVGSAPPAAAPEPVQQPAKMSSLLQKGMIAQLLRNAGVDDNKMATLVATTYGYDLTKLEWSQAESLIKQLKVDAPEVES